MENTLLFSSSWPSSSPRRTELERKEEDEILGGGRAEKTDLGALKEVEEGDLGGGSDEKTEDEEEGGGTKAKSGGGRGEEKTEEKEGTLVGGSRRYFAAEAEPSAACSSPSAPPRSSSSSSSEEEEENGKSEGVAVTTVSVDPYRDFRRSMEEIAEARHAEAADLDWDFMEELLLCFLELNHGRVHKHILRAFADFAVSFDRSRRWRSAVAEGKDQERTSPPRGKICKYINNNII